MEVTRREILVSIIIFFVLLSIGMIINNLIIENHILAVERYNKSLKINNDAELFNYSIDTEVGDVLAYGNFYITDGVKFDELKNDFIYVRKETEEYRMHTREVCSTDSKGKRLCHTETYHSWDTVNIENRHTDKIIFLNKQYNYSMFENYPQYRIELTSNIIESEKQNVKGNYLYKNSNMRYSYYSTPKTFMGTIFVTAKDKTIKSADGSNSISINNTNLEETINNKKSQETMINIIFWIVWFILAALAIYGYVYQENNYLED